MVILFTGKHKRTKRPDAHHEFANGGTLRSAMSAIDNDTILLKSPRGREEVQTRQHDLSTLARRLLIMADGHHTVNALARQLDCKPDDPELQATLQQLVDGRYLHVSDEYDRRRQNAPAGRRKRGKRTTM